MFPKLYADYFRRFDREPEVFVAMPFGHAFDARWRLIFKPAIGSLQLKPVRVKEHRVSDSIPMEILDGIARAKFVLVDVSSDAPDGAAHVPNPNVMYELGLAHALRVPEEVLIVRDSSGATDAPFDIRHIRWNYFHPDQPAKSVRDIQHLLRTAQRELDLTRDRLVERVVHKLDIDLLAFLETIQSQDTFDLYPFDPDRKGLYGLGHRDSSERELRGLARRLITLGLLEPGNPDPSAMPVYGAVPEYVVTPFGHVLLKTLRETRWSKKRKSKTRRLTTRWSRRR